MNTILNKFCKKHDIVNGFPFKFKEIFDKLNINYSEFNDPNNKLICSIRFDVANDITDIYMNNSDNLSIKRYYKAYILSHIILKESFDKTDFYIDDEMPFVNSLNENDNIGKQLILALTHEIALPQFMLRYLEQTLRYHLINDMEQICNKLSVSKEFYIIKMKEIRQLK